MSRPYIKFLSGNYLSYDMKASQSGGSPRCRICSSGSNKTVAHLVSSCQGMSVERNKILEEYKKLCSLTNNQINFTNIQKNENILCQFILDPTSLNLEVWVSQNDPLLPDFFRLSRDYCFLMDNTRIRLIKEIENNLS